VTTVPNRHELEAQFASNWPAEGWCEGHVVLAVSGGPDSVAMLRASLAIKKSFGGDGFLVAAHLDHGLRAEGADSDAAWVGSLCQGLGIRLETAAADVIGIAAQQGDGLEAAARTARYQFLTQTAEKLGARFVAVAHTADDQVETVLHRIVRGTGLAGLGGIPSVRPLSPSVTLMRPLITVRRRDVLDYLSSIGQDFRVDATNADLQWTRNRIRNELLPMLRDHYNANVDEAVLRLATQAGDAQQVISALAAAAIENSVSIEYGASPADATMRPAVCMRAECPALSTQPAVVVCETLRIAWERAGWPQQAMGYDHWQQLAQLVLGRDGRASINLPGNIRARREAGILILEQCGLA
jgi:tRNA(Ile)-lysidine synthase